MFDFENLKIFRKAKGFNSAIRSGILDNPRLDLNTKSQLARSSLSILLNIAEGSGRFTNPDKRRFFIIARGSIYECVALLNFLVDEKILKSENYTSYYAKAEEISKMLFVLIKRLGERKE